MLSYSCTDGAIFCSILVLRNFTFNKTIIFNITKLNFILTRKYQKLLKKKKIESLEKTIFRDISS